MYSYTRATHKIAQVLSVWQLEHQQELPCSVMDSFARVFPRATWVGRGDHRCGISLTPQLDRQLQLDVLQEDLAQVLACLAGDPSHHLTSCANHHPLSRPQNTPESTSGEATLQLFTYEVMTGTWEISAQLLSLLIIFVIKKTQEI